MPLRPPRYAVSESVGRQLARRRWTRRILLFAVIALALSAVLDRLGVFRFRGDDWSNFDRQIVVVTSVIDGDTVRVKRSTDSPEETVRLVGIDAPEAHPPPPAHWSGESTQRLRELAQGKSLTVRLDTTQTRDRYRRLLAYLYANDAENLNLTLVRDGHAYAHRDYPHSMRRQFEQAEDEARAKSRGLWADLNEDQMPQWRRRWLAELRQRKQWDP
jgi:endonuclease YncB( thermonuclease family)